MIGLDVIRMFDDISVSWTRPLVFAGVVCGEARVMVELILVDYWDDDRASARLSRGAEQ